MQEKQSIRELSDEELEGVVGGSTRSTSIGTSIDAAAFAVGGDHINRVLAVTESETILTAEGKGLSFGFGFAMALAL